MRQAQGLATLWVKPRARRAAPLRNCRNGPETCHCRPARWQFFFESVARSRLQSHGNCPLLAQGPSNVHWQIRYALAASAQGGQSRRRPGPLGALLPHAVGCARQRLGTAPRRVADEEDVALSAFDSFCRGVEQGRFPRLEDRDDLRNVLLMLVARKAAHTIRDERCGKRGGGKVSALTDLPGDSRDEEMLAYLIDSEPTPQLAAEMADECCRLLDKLGNADLRAIALWLVEGYTVAEITGKLACSPRTVARKVAQIRDLWSEESLAS
jgi:hypothetical protein